MSRKDCIFWQVCHRGNGGASVFTNEREYRRYLDDAISITRTSKISVHAWCLIRNEIQLVLGNASRAGLRQLMTRLSARHVFRQCGGAELPEFVFEQRFRARFIEDESSLLTACRDVELVPVRMAFATTPESYRWSSYRERAGYERDSLSPPSLIN